jgi:hypothetical protein
MYRINIFTHFSKKKVTNFQLLYYYILGETNLNYLNVRVETWNRVMSERDFIIK